MTAKVELRQIGRRDFVLGAAAAAAFTACLSLRGGPALAANNWQEAVKAAIGDAKPTEGKIILELPEIAENGNTVPFTITVDSPMTDGDYVKKVHVFASGNPRPDVASFSFSPASGRATAKSRMRLGKTQDVIVVAEMNDGTHYMARRTVKVTIGGCGG